MVQPIATENDPSMSDNQVLSSALVNSSKVEDIVSRLVPQYREVRRAFMI